MPGWPKDPAAAEARRLKHLAAMRAYWTPERRAQRAAEEVAKASTPEGRARTAAWKAEYATNAEWRQNLQKASEKRWADPAQRARASETQRRVGSSPSYRQRLSAAQKARWAALPEAERARSREQLKRNAPVKKGVPLSEEHRKALIVGRAMARNDLERVALVEAQGPPVPVREQRAATRARKARLALIRARAKR